MQQIGMIIFRDEQWNTINFDDFLGMKLCGAKEYITSLLMNGRLIVGRKTFESFPKELQESALYKFNVISKDESLSIPFDYTAQNHAGEDITKTYEHVRMLKGSDRVLVFPSITSALLYLTKREVSKDSSDEESESQIDDSPIYFLGGPMVYKEATDLHMCTFIDDVKINTSLTQGATFRKIQVNGWDDSNREKFKEDENNECSVRVKHWKKYPDKKAA